MSAALFIDITLWGSVAVLGFLVWQRGRVVALEITQADLPGWAPVFRMYFHHVVPRVGALVGGDREAYTYLPQSVDRFVGPPALAALMTDVGLRAVKYRRLGFGTVTIHTGVA